MMLFSGRSSVVERQLPKLDMPVRFWSPAVFCTGRGMFFAGCFMSPIFVGGGAVIYVNCIQSKRSKSYENRIPGIDDIGLSGSGNDT